MKNLLRVPPIDWERAKLFFRSPINKNAVYMEKGTSGVGFDFIKIDGIIYALNMNAYLGTGGFGKVRVGEMEDGQNVACKIEPRALKDSDIYENEILNEFGMFIGMLERTLDNPIPMRLGLGEVQTDKIVYRIMELIPGEDLSSMIMQHKLTEKQKWEVAIKAVVALKEIHDKRILHRDIKGGNIKVVIDSKTNSVSVRILDFGFAYKLNSSEVVKFDLVRMGTTGFMAPEITTRQPPVYSFQSDIFALGILFRNLGLPESIYQPMINTAPHLRPDHERILQTLNLSLQDKQETKVTTVKKTASTLPTAKPEDKAAEIPVAKTVVSVLEEVSSNTLITLTRLVREKLLLEIEAAGGIIPVEARKKVEIHEQKRKTRASQTMPIPHKKPMEARQQKPGQTSKPPARLPPAIPKPKSTSPTPMGTTSPTWLPQFHTVSQRALQIPAQEIQVQFMRVAKHQH